MYMLLHTHTLSHTLLTFTHVRICTLSQYTSQFSSLEINEDQKEPWAWLSPAIKIGLCLGETPENSLAFTKWHFFIEKTASSHKRPVSGKRALPGLALQFEAVWIRRDCVTPHLISSLCTQQMTRWCNFPSELIVLLFQPVNLQRLH